MAKKTSTKRYVLLPMRGLRSETPALHDTVRAFMVSLPRTAPLAAAASVPLGSPRGPTLQVVDEIAENGAKLVEMAPQTLLTLRALQPSLRIVPVVYYRP